MNNLLRWAVMLVIAVAAGVWYGLNKSIPPVVFYLGLFIVIFAVNMLPVVYLTYFSTNMSRVERFLLRSSKKPYYELVLDLVNGRLEEAERKLPKLATEQQRLAIQIPIHFEKQNIAALRRQIGEVKKPEARLYYSGLLALLEGDWDKVEKCKQQMRSKVLRSVLDAEAAFKRGSIAEARQYGELAITQSAGLQRYTLIKALERQQKSEARTSYF